MRGKTHAAAGAAIGLGCSIAYSLPVDDACVLTVVAMAASLLPDIDICTSTAGRTVVPASAMIQLLFGHRTIFHAPLIYAAIYVVLLPFLWGTNLYCYLVAATLAIASHIILDLFNRKGIPLFWPWNKRFHIASFRSGGIVDRVLGVLFYLLTLFLAACYLAENYMPLLFRLT